LSRKEGPVRRKGEFRNRAKQGGVETINEIGRRQKKKNPNEREVRIGGIRYTSGH